MRPFICFDSMIIIVVRLINSLYTHILHIYNDNQRSGVRRRMRVNILLNFSQSYVTKLWEGKNVENLMVLKQIKVL